MLLKKGMKGADVKKLKTALGIKADGDFGPKTEKAVKSYQKKIGLVADGIAGKKTIKALGIGPKVMKKYTAKQLVTRTKKRKDFVKIPTGYWIIGIKSKQDAADKFDDMFYLMKGETMVMSTTGTTNPGLRIIKNGWKKYNRYGAAIVESDRIYYDVWKYGLHKGYMPALRQANVITVFRDGDNDEKSEEIGKKMTGMYGINFHTATKSYLGKVIKTLIGGWSAGCQVCNNSVEYMKIINLIKKSKQKRVTFCLLKEF